MRASSILRRLPSLRRRKSGEFFEVVEFDRLKGDRVKRHFPRQLFDRRANLERELLRLGARLPGVAEERKDLLDVLIYSEPKRTGILLATTGWHLEIPAYVLPHQIVAAKKKKRSCWLDENWAKISDRAIGTLDGWKRRIAGPALRSSRLVLGISAALAAPILEFTGQASFGVNIYGQSKGGKTTVLRVAQTLVGQATKKSLLKWNQTQSGFEELAPKYKDRLMPIDEVRASGGKNRASPVTSEAFSYIMSGEVETRRHSSFSKEHGGGGSWRLIVLSTNEKSLDQESLEVRKAARRDGERVRFIDLPMAGKSWATIFDRPPPSVTKDRRNAYGREMLERINRACDKDAGHVIPVFADWLLERVGDRTLRPRVHHYTQEFRTALSRPDDSNLVAELATTFAVIYAGGALGIEAGLLPWKYSSLRKNLRRCYWAAVKQLNDPSRVQREVVRRFWREVRSKAVKWPTSVSPKSRKVTVCKRSRGGAAEYAVYGGVLSQWFPGPGDGKLLIDALKGQIKMDGQNPMSQPQIGGRGDKRRFLVVRRANTSSRRAEGRKTNLR